MKLTTHNRSHFSMIMQQETQPGGDPANECAGEKSRLAIVLTTVFPSRNLKVDKINH
ncbi:MAG: hypothetical protein P5702_07730 [Limnospira sp. PMC 1291.21]|uniref:Uncharacterized protein n=1 Tax=Limnospira fusiformis PMC 851.14 TaxID=2219512 RepID=A0ABU9EGQ9_LIMFS|nr:MULTISPECIES: hypothetical protein [Limnospira]EKD11686.1 hypothetical protein SPLC1_S010830 [Arthrospira platensis C1]MDC0840567.1 hypothetical protein [Limnoraphis robusta]MDT9202886.1 hypothetical protein [Limnospira sp. PMC 1243.20]MDT9237994.1 hypothetical protein [Limnospira sp. PMC 1261.20]MDY7053774.1 hypothetical protein [Limnospira fusiformis LS22]QJB27276.1 hypothetical protein HFV01_17700 [Limnospira fusiformis SAG 85.79]